MHITKYHIRQLKDFKGKRFNTCITLNISSTTLFYL